MKRLLILAPLLALLAGCAPAVGATPSTSPTTLPSATQTPASTVSQWASIVAEQSAYLADWKEKWDEDNCAVAPSSDMLCNMQELSGTFVTQTVATRLDIPTTPKATGYIGTPPNEISDLYEQTQSLADEAVTAGAAWTASCNSTPEAEDCFFLTLDFDTAVQKLTTKFAAWGPYL